MSGPVLHSTNARVNQIDIVLALMGLTSVLNPDFPLVSPAQLL